MFMRNLERALFVSLLCVASVVVWVGTGRAAIWDSSCEKAISSLQGTQERIHLIKHEMVVHEFGDGSTSVLVGSEWNRSQMSESKYLSLKQEMRNLLDLFNVKLKDFSDACLTMNSLNE